MKFIVKKFKCEATRRRVKCAGWTEVTKELWASIQIRRFKKYPMASTPHQARRKQFRNKSSVVVG